MLEVSLADKFILFGTLGYVAASVTYVTEGRFGAAAVFFMYVLCNIVIALGPR